MTLTAQQREQRDEQVLYARISGQTLREIGDSFNLSVEGARLVSDRATRRHVLVTLHAVWEAQKTGDMLVLAVPAASEREQQLAIDYLHFFLHQVDRLMGDNVKLRLHYRSSPSGEIAFGIEDVLYMDFMTSNEEVA
jgi:hypothetical protein